MSEAMVHITFFDTTLRDGAQSLPQENQFPDDSKEEIANIIAQLGVGVIEAGFPRTKGEPIEVQRVAKTVGNIAYPVSAWRDSLWQCTETQTPVIAGLSRTTPEDIEATWDAVHEAQYPRIHTFIATDSEHMAIKFSGKTPGEVLTMGQSAVRYAKQLSSEHPGASVEFSAEAATTTNQEFLERTVKTIIDEGADVINLPDTVSQRHPFAMVEFYKHAIQWAQQVNPNVVVSAHNHNDLDMSTANSFGLVYAAADIASRYDRTVNIQLETTICGLGERAGNADIFPIVGNLFKHAKELSAGIEWRFNQARSVSVAQAVMQFTGMAVHRQSPIVGNDILVHRSGIHSDGVLKGGHQLYTPFNPIDYGHQEDARHEEGKYQGRRGRSAIQTA